MVHQKTTEVISQILDRPASRGLREVYDDTVQTLPEALSSRDLGTGSNEKTLVTKDTKIGGVLNGPSLPESLNSFVLQ